LFLNNTTELLFFIFLRWNFFHLDERKNTKDNNLLAPHSEK